MLSRLYGALRRPSILSGLRPHDLQVSPTVSFVTHVNVALLAPGYKPARPQLMVRARRHFGRPSANPLLVQEGAMGEGTGKGEKETRTGPTRLILTRSMGADETNLYGSVNAGAMLHIMEEAGTIVSTDYCNGCTAGGGAITSLVGVEGVQFLAQMRLGEVAEVEARLAFVSDRSMRVLVDVWARNLRGGDRRQVVRGKFWYVALSADDHAKVVPVSTLDQSATDPELIAAGQQGYKEMMRFRGLEPPPAAKFSPPENDSPGTPRHSEVIHAIAMEPQYCWGTERHARGGVALRWMEETGGITASLHTNYPCLAAALQYTVFFDKLTIGTVIELMSRAVFASPRSLHVRVTATQLYLDPGVSVLRKHVADAIFVFVALDENDKPRPVLPLQVSLESDKSFFEARRIEYNRFKNTSS